MQYYEAVRRGEEAARKAQHLLAKYTGYAIVAMVVKEAGAGWIPVGDENLYALVRKDESLCVLVLCDKDGYVKAMSNMLPCRVAESLAAKMQKDGLVEYKGKLVLPL